MDIKLYINPDKGHSKEMIDIFYQDFQAWDGKMPFWIYIDWLQTIYQAQFPIPDLPCDTWGGKRAGSGKKRIGITKKVSLTLTADQWTKIEKSGKSPSEYIRLHIS
ncbi:hypothetical protein [Thermoactinomyces sp. DSM 45891]|uniref:hypothetical protein n=1 Tax=Thermoactinomyces sp. DSM 45891 TaxID=1761907 RepID=UPI002570EE21|nr:hypothetical protein [Thermoactinomyces sp. DSM 45891]